MRGVYLLSILLLVSPNTYAKKKSICGAEDDRIVSYDPKVGRAFKEDRNKGCTVTMIGRTCAISAGHCRPHLKKVAFNTPLSRGGVPVAARPEDTYPISQFFMRSVNRGPGKDWAVFKVKKNELTGKYAGDVQGFYPVDLNLIPQIGEKVKITGYGRDYDNPDRNFAQQTNTAEFLGLARNVSRSPNRRGRSGRSKMAPSRDRTHYVWSLSYNIDTTGGNSGSAVMHVESGKIIGIHSHAGCDPEGGANHGTAFARREKLQKAIKQCLKYD